MNKVSLETRIAVLEDQILYMHGFYMVLLNLIFRYDDRLRLTAIEAIRRILQNPIPTHPLNPAVQQLLQSLRDDLLAPPDPSIASALSQSPVRPVK
jgi:hypothetical protein